jgi:hypothetical protein
MTLNDLLADILGRIEENVENGPIFWDLVGEVYPMMVDGMNEAALVTGTVQSVSQPFVIPANTTYFNVPRGTIAPLRMRAPYPIRKASLRGLDDMEPNWQTQTPGTQIRVWFPLGVTRFGIFPQLAANSTVIMDFIASPVQQARPYSGAVAIPFQQEFTDAFSEYGAAMLRAKEGGAEAEEASVVYQEYMEKMKALSAFQGRLDALVMTSTWGGKAMTNPRKAV